MQWKFQPSNPFQISGVFPRVLRPHCSDPDISDVSTDFVVHLMVHVLSVICAPMKWSVMSSLFVQVSESD